MSENFAKSRCGGLAVFATMAKRGLMEQDLSKLDVTTLHPLSPEVISRQATINIGTIGHVAHGKSTVVKAISGVQVRIPMPAMRKFIYVEPQFPG